MDKGWTLAAVAVGLVGCSAKPADSMAAAPAATWSSEPPACTEVDGAAITFTRDGGASLARYPLSACAAITAVVALEAPDTLIAMQTCPEAILRSTDRGCTWRVIDEMDGGDSDGGQRHLAASAGDRAYAWSVGEGGDHGTLVRIDGDEVTLRRHTDYVSIVAADAADRDRVALVTGSRILHSADGGETFTRAPLPHGAEAAAPGRTDTFAVDTLSSTAGYVYTTHDGGESWSSAIDEDNEGGPFAIDGSGQVIWHVDETVATKLSVDGGATFSPVGPSIPGWVLVVDPLDARVLWWVAGSSLGHLRAGDAEPTSRDVPLLKMARFRNTVVTTPNAPRLSALAFSPGDHDLVYLAVMRGL